MGIDIHNLGLLSYGQDLGVRFDRTLAIGRQALFLDDRALEDHRCLRGLPPFQVSKCSGPAYFEPLLKQWYGAQVADSVDASSYESASLIHDMNLPWPDQKKESGSYDAVLDFGCLEHVFNFPVAWRNCVDLCRPGGHVMHALPANNLAGHGFYQFSPELFFNLYRPENGFELKALFYAIKAESRYWWKVANPMEVRRRVNLCSSHEVYMLVIAQKKQHMGEMPPPQQSDYAQDEWLSAGHADGTEAAVSVPWSLRVHAANLLGRLGLIEQARRGRECLRALARSGLALPEPDYERVVLSQLLGSSAQR